jgi:hypothetical protein
MLIGIYSMLLHNFRVNIDHYLTFLIDHSYIFVLHNVAFLTEYIFLNNLNQTLNIMVVLQNFYVIA